MKLFHISVLACLSLLLGAQTASSKEFVKCVPGKSRAADETCLVDGDTIWLDGNKLRLKGFDTPEPMTKICGGKFETELARKASDRLLYLLNTKSWTIEYFGKERNGKRTLATIRISGRDVGDILIDERLARRWPDGDEWWCN